MPDHKQIYLTGFMASGKSTAGKQLAARLGMPFIDLDHEISVNTGLSIAELFEKKGEEEFRRIELAELRKFSNTHPAFVMATGGGTFCSKEAMSIVKNSLSIYLKLPEEIILGRLRQNRSDRPLVSKIAEDDLAAYIKDKLNIRLPYYEQASLIINAENLKISDLEKLVRAQLK